jgi:hypothetical protein
MSKYGSKTCTVSGELIDDLIVGMPILIVDGDFSVMGVLGSFSYSVDGNGTLGTNINVMYPMSVFFDKIPDPPMWLNLEDLEPSKIHEMYQILYGCGSIYPKSLGISSHEGRESTLRICVRKLIDDFGQATNRRLYVEKYRARTTDSEEYVFGTKHGAHTVTDNATQNKTVMWTGKDFSPFVVGLAQAQADSANQTEKVDRRQIVLDYLRDYYGKPGRVEYGQ